MVKKQMPSGAMVWYVIINILTLGIPYFIKITIMKAIIDSQDQTPTQIIQNYTQPPVQQPVQKPTVTHKI